MGPWWLPWHLCLYICEKCEMSRLWHTDTHTHGQWKVVQYSVWAESAKGETNYILTIKNKMYRIRNLIEIFIFDKGGPSWIFPLEVKKYAALMVFETFLMRTPERIKSKAKKERRLRTILVRNTTWLWLSRPKISPPISQHFLVQLSSPFKSLHFKSRFHWYHSSTFHVSFLRGTFYLSIESSSHRYLVSETDCGIYWLI